MKQIFIRLPDMQRVLDFVRIMERENARADIAWGRYRLRATSFLGILNMDLTKPLELHLYGEAQKQEAVMQKIADYMVLD